MPNIIVRNYEHINRSFSKWDTPYGKRIHSKKHYEEECKKEGMIPYERAQEQAEKTRREQTTDPRRLSSEALGLAKAAFEAKRAGRGGEHPSGRMIEAYKKVANISGSKLKAINHYYNTLPSHYNPKGGSV